jgi:hypothetical protein
MFFKKNLILILSFILFFNLNFLFGSQNLNPNKNLKKLYHFGEKRILQKNVKYKTILDSDWEKIINAKNTRYQYYNFRGGLYAVVHPAYAENFGNWFIELTIKDECLTQNKVAILSEKVLEKEFVDWLKVKEKIQINEFYKTCMFEQKDDEGVIRKILKVENLQASGSGFCENIVDKFIKEKDLKLILDEQWMDQENLANNLASKVSWIIKDKNCIEDIKGSDEDFLKMTYEIPYFWKQIPTSNSKPLPGTLKETSMSSVGMLEMNEDLHNERGRVYFFMLLDVLKEKDFNIEILKKVNKEVLKSDIEWSLLVDEKASVREIVSRLIMAKLRCESRGDQKEFFKVLSLFYNRYESLFELANYPALEKYAFISCVRELSSDLVLVCR